MSRKCSICGKKPLVGNNVSHAHNKTKKVSNPNLQKVKVITDGGGTKKIVVCTSCIRSGFIKKAS